MPSSSLESQAVRKIRARILPFVFLLYIVAFLDRINIGFAALTMNRAIGVSSEQFGLIAGVFFIGYFLFEIPSNLLLHKIGARIWIARILVSWGVVAMLTGFSRSVGQLYALRFLLGVAEAGFFPGIVLYLTYWFRRREQAQAFALFMTAIPVATVLGSPVSGLILDHAHWLGISSWRWLLVLEGIPALVCGVLTSLFLPSRPEEARFLTAEEKEWVATELAREQRQVEGHLSTWQTLRSPRVWHLAATYFGMTIGLYSISFWLPQVVKSLSRQYSNTTVGFLVMLPHLVGLAAMVIVSRSSDRRLERRYHAAVPLSLAGVALLLLVQISSPLLTIVIFMVVASGIYSFFAPFWALPAQFLTGVAAASGIALINSIGNLGGLAGPYLVGAVTRKTGSLNSGLALVGISLLFSALLVTAVRQGRSAVSAQAGAADTTIP